MRLFGLIQSFKIKIYFKFSLFKNLLKFHSLHDLFSTSNNPSYKTLKLFFIQIILKEIFPSFKRTARDMQRIYKNTSRHRKIKRRISTSLESRENFSSYLVSFIAIHVWHYVKINVRYKFSALNKSRERLTKYSGITNFTAITFNQMTGEMGREKKCKIFYCQQ